MLTKIISGFCVALVLTLAAGAGTASAAAQGPWVQPATDLSFASQAADFPQVTTAPDGTAIAVWYRFNGTVDIVQSATRPPGGSFGAPVDLSAPGQDAVGPQVTAAPDGTITAVWSRFNGSHYVVQAATRPPGGSFGAPVDVSATGQTAFNFQIITGRDGTSTVVLRRYNGNHFIIQAATRPPGGSFGAPVDLSAPGQNASDAQVATTPGGTTTAAWLRSDGTNTIIQAATRPAGGSFGPPVDLSAPGQNASDPHVSTAPDGTSTVVWSRFNGTNYIIQAATLPDGGSFGQPVDLSAPGQSAVGARSTTAPDGTTTVVWSRSNGTNYVIQAVTRPPGGSFSPPIDLSAPGQSAFDPQITLAPDGSATVIWYRSNGTNNIIQAATRPPGGSFGAPVDLSASGQDATQPQISTGRDNTTTAVWRRSNGSSSVIQSIATAQPTFTLGVAKQGEGIVKSSPAGILCGADCAESFASFKKVLLTAAPDSGSTFTGWTGACAEADGNTCRLTMLENENTTATFRTAAPSGKARLKILKVAPRKPRVKRGKTVKIKIKARNTGDVAATNTKLCLRITKAVARKIKPAGKTCHKLGSLGVSRAKTRTFRLKATRKATRGKRYRVTFKLSGRGVMTVRRGTVVMVR